MKWLLVEFYVLLAILMTAEAMGQKIPNDAVRQLEGNDKGKSFMSGDVRRENEELLEYFRTLNPSRKSDREVKALFGQLGSQRFDEREDASRQLAALARGIQRDLQQGSLSNDLEIAWRSKRILAEYSANAPQKEASLLAALEKVEYRKPPGILPLLVDALPLCERSDIRRASEQAMMAVARSSDGGCLRTALRSPHAHVRITTLSVYDALFGDTARGELILLLTDREESVRLAAALVLVNRADNRALPVLGKLLDSSKLGVRTRAVNILKSVTGRDFGFVTYDTVERRATAAAKWQRWIKEHGENARLVLPATSDAWLGKILFCTDEGSVVELDETGKKVWELKHFSASCCKGLTNGHRLVGSGDGRVDEYDAAGKRVWRLEGLPSKVGCLCRVFNGNTLVVCDTVDEERVIQEFRPDKSICWEWWVKDKPTDVKRLDDGHTLVALSSGKVLELDRRGKPYWQFVGDLQLPASVQRLENGNTLICDFYNDKIVEVDRSAKVVHSNTITRPSSAQRLPNGNTILRLYDRIVEINAVGKIVRKWDVRGVQNVCAY